MIKTVLYTESLVFWTVIYKVKEVLGVKFTNGKEPGLKTL